jgi:hypothetical protein
MNFTAEKSSPIICAISAFKKTKKNKVMSHPIGEKSGHPGTNLKKNKMTFSDFHKLF